MKTATFLRKLDGFRGDARLYILSEPIAYEVYDEDTDEYIPQESDYVVVSAIITFSGSETYIFPANEDGEVVKWGELDGSFRGGLDHKKALARAGYKTIQ